MARRVAHIYLTPGAPFWCHDCSTTSRLNLYRMPKPFHPAEVRLVVTVCMRCREGTS